MAKKLFGLLAVVGAMSLTACCGSCPGPQVYKKPCCAQSGGSSGGGYMAPAPAPMAPRPAAAPASNCGAGKCA